MSHSARQREFSAHFAECERELLGYILTMVPSHSDALDVLQEAAVAMWQKYDEYQGIGSFRSWAYKFSHIQVLKYRERQRYRDWMLKPFDESVIAALVAAHHQHEPVLEIRRQALKQCLEKLTAEQNQLLRTRYWEKTTLRAAAERSGCSEDRLHRQLNKIREQLRICIDRTIVAEGADP